MRRQGLKDLKCKDFAWILLVNFRPTRSAKNPNYSQQTREKRAHKDNQEPMRVRLLSRHIGRIYDFDAGAFFGLLDLGQFIALRKRFKNRFLKLGVAVQVRVIDSEQRQFPD